MSTRMDAQAQVAEILLTRIRNDRYPSWTEMAMLEDSLPTLPPKMTEAYLRVLLEKVVEDSRPSIPMLRHIQQLTAT